jgi:hypothetical protein
MQTVMQEAVRVLARGGHLVAGLALFSAGTKAILGEIGLVYEQQMQLPRFFDLWHAGPHEKQWAQLISNWNHITQAEAANVVIKYRDILYATYANWEQFAQPLRDQGLAPADVLRTLVNTPVPLFTFDDYSSLFTQNGLTVCESYWEPEVNTLNLMGKK